MRIREELFGAQEGCGEGGSGLVDSRERLATLVSKFEVAFGKYSAVSREEDASLKPSFSAMEIFLQQLKAHGGCMWACGGGGVGVVSGLWRAGRTTTRANDGRSKGTCPHHLTPPTSIAP